MTRLFIALSFSALLITGCKQHGTPETTEVPSASQTLSNGVVGLEVGNTAPDLTLQSPDGTSFTLSSLRGKVVLVDFWASWCMPCRMENPNVVRIYNEYKDEELTEGNGFTIFSVSLDKNRKNWTDAIEHDKLAWEYHVSDLLGWDSAPAAVYEIASIPSSFLLNGEGVIIAKNLRAKALEDKIKSLVK
jgi:thiol-disulfide isomerase/thioredoxin